MNNTDNCWKRIGVWSSNGPRCPELAKVIHCRNCEVFTRAGRNLLDRPLPEGYTTEWADILASEKEENLFNMISVVIFRIEDEWLALPTQIFTEVIAPDRLLRHGLPHRGNTVLMGLINVRGEIQLLVSLKELLNIEGDAGESMGRKIYKRMMVIQHDGEKWVFPVNEIRGIHRVHPNIFENVPVTVAKAQSTFTKGIFKWEDKHVAFLDDDLLFFSLTRNVQ